MPDTKLVPVKVRTADPVFDAAEGLTELTVGAGFTVKQFVHVPDFPSVLVTVTFLAPVVAPLATSTWAVT